jgi:DNA end-binding protein Ku
MAERKNERERARAFWSGTLTFGLVSVPVDLYAGNRPSRVRLHMLDEDGTPLRRRYVCPEDGEELESNDIVRGYEVEEGRYVVVTDDELEALEPAKSRDIDLRRFVPRDALDPLFFERGYFLAPGGGSVKAYRLLAETMERTGMAGIATFVMRAKEYLVAILSENGLLRAETLRFADEIRTPADIGLPARPKRANRKAAAEIEKQIAKAAIDRLDESELEDRYADRLLALVEKKRAKRTDVVRSRVPVEEDEDEGVIDLMALLRKRLGGSSGGTKRGGSSPPGRGAVRKRASGNGRSRKRAAGTSSAATGEDLASRSKDELYQRAQELDIPGRSGMSKPELVRALRRGG